MIRLVATLLTATVVSAALPAQADTATKSTFDSKLSSLRLSANRDPDVLVPPTVVSEDTKEQFAEKRPRLILALGGGAFKSVAQIGVIRCLEEKGIRIDGVVGTSLGATIGALYSSGMSVNDIEKLFTEDKIQNAMFKGVIVRYILKPLAPLKHLAFGSPYAGISTGKGYLKFLSDNLPDKFSELKKPFAAVATNLTDGVTTVFSEGDLPKSVLASNAVPTIFRPVMIEDKLYVDGGLRANLPNIIAKKLGADIVISVLVDKAITTEPNKKFKSKNAVVMRVADIMMAAADHPKAEAADILIYPNVDFIPPVTKDKELIERAIEVGYKAAEQMVPQIKAEILASEKRIENQRTAATPSVKGEVR